MNLEELVEATSYRFEVDQARTATMLSTGTWNTLNSESNDSDSGTMSTGFYATGKNKLITIPNTQSMA